MKLITRKRTTQLRVGGVQLSASPKSGCTYTISLKVSHSTWGSDNLCVAYTRLEAEGVQCIYF